MNQIKKIKYVAVSPYIIPAQLRQKKVVNIGDGFILAAVMRLMGASPTHVISSREAPSESDIEIINSCDYLVLAGANQLNDNFTVFPGFTAEKLKKIRVPILPVGIGIHGVESFNQGPKPETVAILREIHERIAASSWRCHMTTQYLLKFIPEIASQVMMTGCPVAYDHPILDSQKEFLLKPKTVAVTVTDRGDFFATEMEIVNSVREEFREQKLALCFHQDMIGGWRSAMTRTPLSGLLSSDPYTKFRHEARKMGYEIVVFKDYQEAFQFYEGCDLHIGSRLHAHLYFTSKAKPSYLYGFDNRQKGIAAAYGMRLMTQGDYSLDKKEFDGMRATIQKVYQDMLQFKKLNGIV